MTNPIITDQKSITCHKPCKTHVYTSKKDQSNKDPFHIHHQNTQIPQKDLPISKMTPTHPKDNKGKRTPKSREREQRKREDKTLNPHFQTSKETSKQQIPISHPPSKQAKAPQNSSCLLHKQHQAVTKARKP